MIVAEALVVRSVARLVHVQQRDDQPRAVVRATDPARRLDVLGVHLRLPEHQHQSQAGDVEADRNHVRRQRAVDAVVSIVEGAFQPPARLGHLVGRHARGQLQHLREGGAVAEQPLRLTDPPPRPIARNGRADLLLQDATGPAQLAQAVEVGERRHVGIGRVPRIPVAAALVPGERRRAHQRQLQAAHQHLGVAALRGDADVEPRGRLRRRHGTGEKGVAPIRSGRREHLGQRPGEQRLDLVLRPPGGGGRGDDLRLDRPAVDLAHGQCLDGRLVEASHRAERAGDQMQLVLDYEVRRRERRLQALTGPGFGGTVEALLTEAVSPAEQRTGLPYPWERRELIHRRD